jgi:hypothetical protein
MKFRSASRRDARERRLEFALRPSRAAIAFAARRGYPLALLKGPAARPGAAGAAYPALRMPS